MRRLNVSPSVEFLVLALVALALALALPHVPSWFAMVGLGGAT